MSALALLRANPSPTDAEIDAGLAGNLCRCGTYVRIKDAIHSGPSDRTVGADANATTGSCRRRKTVGYQRVKSDRAVTHENGRVQQLNCDRYPILRIAHAPRVDVHFVASDYPPTGFGEPALPPLAPAVCNAVLTATSHRIRRLPIIDEGFSV